jgi:hypothetical protein
MYKYIITVIFFFFVLRGNSQSGLWTWVNGDSALQAPPVYGTQGVFDSLNHPLGSYEGCEWTDKQGNFWFFESKTLGGWGNDLWKYSPILEKWAFIKGSQNTNDPGNYGTKGVASSANIPPARGFGIASWTDTTGNLWMYGGTNNLNSQWNTFNDLWKFDITTNNWTWISGDTIPNQSPEYGVKGIPSVFNSPGARSEMVCTWVDSLNNLWLFGGASSNFKAYSDLWKYSIATNQWTWMKGDSTLDGVGYFGIKGVEDSLNNPSARWVYSRWKDNDDNFWIFGGKRYNSGSFYLNDLWKYSMSTNNWTWIKGPNNLPLDTGNTGYFCNVDTAFNPISRNENRSCWKDNDGNFWMFGGATLNLPVFSYGIFLNDMWKYNIQTNEWTLVWSDTTYNTKGSFGVKGVPSYCNRPLGRMGSVSWYQPSSNSMYLFGGYQYYIPGSGRPRSVMWKYEIDTSCTVHYCNTTGFTSDFEYSNLNLFPNPTASSITLKASFGESSNLIISVYNYLGIEIYRQEDIYFSGDYTHTIDLFSEETGIYILKLQTRNNIYKGKIIKY